MSKSFKIIMIVILAAALVGGGYLWWRSDNSALKNAICARFGKTVEHGAGRTCEMRAWDGGRKCTYDNECSTQVCLYKTGAGSNGNCDDYSSDNDGKSTCHRPKNQDIKCDLYISERQSNNSQATALK